MKQKLLCGILAALMLTSAVACTGGGNHTETETGVDTDRKSTRLNSSHAT